MSALISSSFLLLVSESLHLRRALAASRSVLLHTSVKCMSLVEPSHGSLTLSSIGFQTETEADNRSKSNKVKLFGSPSENLESKGKPIDTIEKKKKAFKVVEKQQMEFAPFAAKSFSELGLSHVLIERLEKEGFTVPTEVQSAAVPSILNNRDVIIQSYTGSGKTLAYLLPILSVVGPLRVKGDDGDENGKKLGIEAVIVAPSRELGMQIVREFEKVLGMDNKRVVQQLVGGANRTRQEDALKKNKPAIVVGTPGRIAELSASGKLRTHGCRYLVLDEVDELLSFNFREDMHRILEHVGRRSSADPNSNSAKTERQLIMVSATVPFSVVRAARSWGCDPLLVQAKKIVPLETFSPSDPVTLSRSSPSSAMPSQAAVESLPPALKHYYCVTRLQHKVDVLRRCIHALDAKYVIAFMNHTKQLKDVVFKLEARGVKAVELHGDLGKLARSTTLKKFKNGEVRVLVTNELSARGLDVAECDLVVNLDLPTDSIHYAHRAGRTGRLGRNGTVLTICEEPEVFVVKKLQKQLGIPIASCDFSEGKLLITEEEKTLSTSTS
ncbi:DEAD-box ATP-dependent RNA helicase 47, mitochondrial [Vigna radiata var. radiata]|uniref:RNA helicase n=1 Tax=Vigna radiata var. radiata TaxID=3916 RepID=A0A1S3U550_VIGRR|nr:DEAD-box ATP-dependent RNA helicase 47, mitochondrial [Vigna radiata var. radiata]XP_022636814.1 DEAD-box ATP-dependent RNA helicase 47, mitochondrial [Vigna radiata var. radiata]